MSTQPAQVTDELNNAELLVLAKATREQYRRQVRDGHAVLDPGKLRRFDSVISDYEAALRG